MKRFDVIIIGSGVSAITSATYLSNRLRKVALFLVDDDTKVQKISRTVKDSEGHRYNFTIPYHEFGGLDKDELLSFYLNRLGIKEKFKVIENEDTAVVKRNQRVLSRPNDFKGFRLYLVRHYPKSRDVIHRFFKDLSKHYDNFKMQKQAFLRGEPYTITSIQAAWGTKSLKDVLTKYFNQPDLMREFAFMQHSIGLELEDINAYFYFIRWFNVFMEKSYYIQNTYQELNKLLLPKNPNLTVFKSDDIERIEVEKEEICRLVTNKGVYEADYFCVNAHPRQFIDRYLKEGKGLITKRVDSMFKDKIRNYQKRIAYLGIDCSPDHLGVTKTRYMFEGRPEDTLRVLSLINYNRLNSSSSEKGRGSLLVEFFDKPETDLKKAIKDTLKRYFRKIDEHITVMEISEGSDYAGSYDFAKDQQKLSLTKRFAIEQYRYVNVWKNSYFIGSYTRPESGITGLIQMGVDVGERIEQDLDYQISESVGITPDVLMNVVAHQMNPNILEQPKRVLFEVSKNTYLFDTGSVTLQRVRNVQHDIKFKTTVEGLYQMAIQCKPFKEASEAQLFEYQGDVNVRQFYKLFNLGRPMKSMIYPSIRPWGSLFFYSLIGIFVLFSLLTLSLPLMIASTVLFGLHLIKLSIQSFVLRKIITFDVSMTGISLIIALYAWFYPDGFWDLSYYWLTISGVWILHGILGTHVTHQYFKYDYEAKLAYTPFFITMMRGLTTLWLLTFLLVSLSYLALGEIYRPVGLYLIVFMAYLTFKYPILYIQSSIKKGGE